jgi:site-specific DNA recombinase
VRGLAGVLETLDAASVGFRSATEPFDTTSLAGRMMVQMLGVFAEFERATIIDQVIAGMERKASTSGWCGDRALRLPDREGEGRLIGDEDEVPLIAVIFDLYVTRRLASRQRYLAERCGSGYARGSSLVLQVGPRPLNPKLR